MMHMKSSAGGGKLDCLFPLITCHCLTNHCCPLCGILCSSTMFIMVVVAADGVDDGG